MKKIPPNHELREPKNGQAFSLVFHDNGEARLTRNGFRGAEYYTWKIAIARVKEFVDAGYRVAVECFFVCGDEKSDYYVPGKPVIEEWGATLTGVGVRSCCCSIANVLEADGSKTSMPNFYAHREIGEIGFVAASIYKKEILVPLELSLGIDSCAHNSNYK